GSDSHEPKIDAAGLVLRGKKRERGGVVEVHVVVEDHGNPVATAIAFRGIGADGAYLLPFDRLPPLTLIRWGRATRRRRSGQQRQHAERAECSKGGFVRTGADADSAIRVVRVHDEVA